MKLYADGTPNCRKVEFVAAFLEIPLEVQEVKLAKGEQKKPEYLAMNPMGKVPLLTDGDFCLFESNAIMQYVASKKPGNPLWPSDDKKRADIARWQFWAMGHWSPPLGIFLRENFFKPMRGGTLDPEALKQADADFRSVAKVLDAHLAKHKFLCGDQITLADPSVGMVLMWADKAKLPIADFPNIMKWFGRLQEFPAWKKSERRF